jgi:AMMECR1 domain-containing protein
LVLDAFALYKKSTKKDKSKAEDFVDKFKKFNTTISIIPRGCIGYIQPLDVSINKIMKSIIQQYKEDY